ncbi:MAG: DNA repair protein RecO [Acidobacteriota bacterium]
MPLEQSEALILRSFDTGEQDKIVIFFTCELGFLHGIAKGARKFNNRFGSTLEPFSHVQIFYYEKEHKDLVTLNNADLKESFFELLSDYQTACNLSYLGEITEEFFPQRHKEEVLFRLLLATLKALKKGSDLNFTTAYFEAWLMKITGFCPDFSLCLKCRKRINGYSWLARKKEGVYCALCAPDKKTTVPSEILEFMSWIKINPPFSPTLPPLTSEQLTLIRKIFQDIIVFHLEKTPKTLHLIQLPENQSSFGKKD